MECNISHQKILFGFFKINFAAGINNPAAERQATKQIMDLIGEKFGATIGAKRNLNSFIHPLRMVGRQTRSMFQTNSRTEIQCFNSQADYSLKTTNPN